MRKSLARALRRLAHHIDPVQPGPVRLTMSPEAIDAYRTAARAACADADRFVAQINRRAAR